MEGTENQYLNQVLEQQQQVDLELRKKQSSTPPVAATRAARVRQALAPEVSVAAGRAVEWRVTGMLWWRSVVVPPNVYVVHTRRGRAEPLHIGMGLGFRFNPRTDAFLVIPAAVQTITINARCICKERQGILVQAYVQWIVGDVATAYRKLDFSDPEDPMRIVNVQLREQAEAAIKDKVATLGIDEVLADKQPIIEELTHRLRVVAEGTREGGAASGGLGLQIVTVQIKEAVVSSTSVWQNLQMPFRAERERLARLASLDSQRQVAERELQIQQARHSAELAAASDLARQKAEAERAVYDRTQSEKARRAKVEQESERAGIVERGATEKVRREAELDLALCTLALTRDKVGAELETLTEETRRDAAIAERAKQQAVSELALEEQRSVASARRAEREVAELKARRAVENEVSEGSLRAQLVAALPKIAAELPEPKELKSVQISSDGATAGASALAGLVATVLGVLDGRKAAATKAVT